MSRRPRTIIEILGRDPDDWPVLTPQDGHLFEQQLDAAQEDDLVDGVDLQGRRFFLHKQDVERVSHWE
ncbi:MAG TPA: hypothetical protein VGN78_10565 [Solirubrobacteraceae bacterium]|nr:hypothetical protein [Solirubrobacteraceae bacterium]